MLSTFASSILCFTSMTQAEIGGSTHVSPNGRYQVSVTRMSLAPHHSISVKEIKGPHPKIKAAGIIGEYGLQLTDTNIKIFWSMSSKSFLLQRISRTGELNLAEVSLLDGHMNVLPVEVPINLRGFQIMEKSINWSKTFVLHQEGYQRRVNNGKRSGLGVTGYTMTLRNGDKIQQAIYHKPSNCGALLAYKDEDVLK